MGRLHSKHRTARRGLHFRKVNSWVEVARNPEHTNVGLPKGKKFTACVRIGYGNVRKGNPTNLGSCATGKNPRKAIAAALRKAARTTSSRSGAFAGLRRR